MPWYRINSGAQEGLKAVRTDMYTVQASIQLAKEDIRGEEVLGGVAGWTVKESPSEFSRRVTDCWDKGLCELKIDLDSRFAKSIYSPRLILSLILVGMTGS